MSNACTQGDVTWIQGHPVKVWHVLRRYHSLWGEGGNEQVNSLNCLYFTISGSEDQTNHNNHNQLFTIYILHC